MYKWLILEYIILVSIYDEKLVNKNFMEHDPNSSLLIGKLEKDDIIKERFV